MNGPIPRWFKQRSAREGVLTVLERSSPEGEDVVVRMRPLPKWWEKRAPRLRLRRQPPESSVDEGARPGSRGIHPPPP